jgi:hypothetical protein
MLTTKSGTCSLPQPFSHKGFDKARGHSAPLQSGSVYRVANPRETKFESAVAATLVLNGLLLRKLVLNVLLK